MIDYGKLYKEVHENQKALPGYTICRYADRITALVRQFNPKTLLDFGAGKGYQYLGRRVHEPWGILPHCYDPGVRQLDKKPSGKFDGVLNVDVLEHIDEADLDTVIAELVGYADKFAFIAVSCRPSKKNFADGSNFHKTIKPPEWWEPRIKKHANGVYIETAYELP